MPVATIGLFALALVVVGLAFAIQNIVSDGDDDALSPADSVATSAALNATRTAQAGGNGEQTQQPGQTTTQAPNQTRTPGTGTAPAGTRTPGNGTPNAGGDTYVVKEGDFCGAIASDNGITLEELLEANDMTEDDCTSLEVGQELTIPD